MALTVETRQFAGQNAARLLGRLAFQMNATMKAPDPDAVHDLRVAIRRFTQALNVFKPCFPGKEKRKIHRRLKRLMTQAGAVRDWDVAFSMLTKSRSAEAAGLRPKIQSQRKEGERVLIGSLKRRIERKSSLKWRTALESALGSAEEGICHDPIAETARRTLPHMAKDFLELGNSAAQAKSTPQKLHRFRVACKKFRYSLELFAPLYGSSLKRWIETIKHAQNLLGEVTDCATTAEIVSAYKDLRATSAWLRKRGRRKTEEFRQWWPDAFSSREVLRTWMRDLGNPPSGVLKKPMARAVAHHERAAAAGAR